MDAGGGPASFAGVLGRIFARLVFSVVAVAILAFLAAPKAALALVRSLRPEGFDLGRHGALYVAVGLVAFIAVFVVPIATSPDADDDDDDDTSSKKRR